MTEGTPPESRTPGSDEDPFSAGLDAAGTVGSLGQPDLTSGTSASDTDASEATGSAAEVSDTFRRIVRSGLWSIFGHFGTAAAAFLVSVIVARALGPEPFGQYSLYLYIAREVPIILAFGVPAAIRRMVAEREGAGDTGEAYGLARYGFRLHLWILPIPVLLATAAVWVSSDKAVVGFAVGGAIVFGLLTRDLEALLQALRRFKTLAIVAPLGGAAQVIGAFVAFALNGGWPAYVALQTVAVFVGAIVLWVPCRDALAAKRAERLSQPDRRAFIRMSAALALAPVLGTVVWGPIELFLLNRYSTEEAVGYYAAGLRIAFIAAVLPFVAGAPLVSEFAWLSGGGHHDALKETYRRVCRVLVAVGAPISIGGALVAAPLVTTLYGGEFFPASDLTAILLVGSLVNALTGPATALVITGPRPRFITEISAIVAVLNISLNVWLIPIHGVLAAAAVNVVVQGLAVLAGLTYGWLKRGLVYPGATLLRTVAFSGVAGVVARIVVDAIGGTVGLVIAIGVAAVVYFMLLIGTRTFDVSELKALAGRRGGDSPE